MATSTKNRDVVWGDLFVDVKWHFGGDGKDGLQLAYRPGFSIPVGDENDASSQAAGLGYWTISQALIASWLERRWVLGAEAGFLLPIGDRGEARGLGFGSFGAGYQLAPRFKPEIELNYLNEVFETDAESEVLAVTAGLVINPSDWIRLDLGLRRGIWGENVDQRVTGSVNVSFTFGSRNPP